MKTKPLIVLCCLQVLGVVFLRAFQFRSEEIADREKWEDFLQTAEIVAAKQLGGPWRITLEKAETSRGAVWKNPEGRLYGNMESWKWEIAAYRLDKHLELNMVPPTVEREFQGKRGSCQLWVTVEMDMMGKMREKIQTPPDKAFSVNRAIYLQRAFDNLIANKDRHAGSILITKDWRLILIDHSRSFGTSGESTSELIFAERKGSPGTMRSLPRAFIEKLIAFNFGSVAEIVDGYLTEEEIEAVLHRRNLILDEIARLIEKYGEENVLY